MVKTKKADYLNNILRFLYESANGYDVCMESTNDNNLKPLFAYLNQQRLQMIDEIRHEVETLGGQSEEADSLISNTNKWYKELKNKGMNGDLLIFIAIIKRGENLLLDHYREALRQEFSENARILLLSHLEQIEDELKHIETK